MSLLHIALSLALSILALLGVVLFYLRRSVRQKQQLQRLQEELELLRQEAGRIDTDPLTGLLNRSALARWIETEQGFQGLLVVCDLDNFKVLNDQYGHLVGDEILHGFGQLVRTSIRQEDRAFRWGGDEFVIFFRNLDRDVVETRMRGIEEHLRKFQIRHHGPMAIRFSWGTASATGQSLPETLEEADRRMYEFKRSRQLQAPDAPPPEPHAP
jgi:diguanylate cyclase (GGDEF)-like protein